MASDVLNISGIVYQGASTVTSGYVRAQNRNNPALVSVVPIGEYETGEVEAGRFDIWFRAIGTETSIATVGDVIELTVYNNGVNLLDIRQQTVPSATLASRLFLKLMPPLTPQQINNGYIFYEIQGITNELPQSPIILPENNIQDTNKQVIEWIWQSPIDPDKDRLHFQLQWSTSPTFAGVVTMSYDTRDEHPVDLFTYERLPGVWEQFPQSGLLSDHYGKKCRFKIKMARDGVYYWRVRATDGVDR